MKKKDFVQLKTKDISDLTKIVTEKRKEFAGLTVAPTEKNGKKNVKKSKNLRREIAQILTLVREKLILVDETKQTQKN